MLGALPANARPYNEREEVYRSEDAADIAEVRIAALITLGRPFIPALSIQSQMAISQQLSRQDPGLGYSKALRGP